MSRASPDTLAGLTLLCASLGAACVADPTPPLRVQLGGCVEWRRGGTCVLGEEPLVLWVEDHALGEVTARGSGGVTPHERAAIQGGVRLQLREVLGPHDTRGWIELGGRRGARYRLEVEREPADPALLEVARLRHAGRRPEAEAQLVGLGARPGAAGERARNALAAGEVARAIEAFEASIAEAEAGDRPLAALRDRCALAHTLASREHAYARASATLAPLVPLAERYAGAELDLAYFRLVIATEHRDVRAGLAHVRRLAALAERLAQPEPALDGEQMLTDLLVFAGRWPEAARALEDLARSATIEPDACKAAELWSNIGWYRLVGHRQAPELLPAVPWAALDRAAALYAAECPRPDRLANAELNRAWAALTVADRARAERHHAAALAAVPTPDASATLHLLHLEAELALQDGRPDAAQRAFERLGADAQAADVIELRWQAELGRAKALEARGRAREALAAYQESEARLADLAERIPLGEARDGLFFDRGEGAARGVALGVASEQLDAAIALVRTSRRGALAWTRALDAELDQARLRDVVDARDALEASARDAWSLPADRMAAAAAERDARQRDAVAALDALFARTREVPRAPAAHGADEVELYAHPVESAPTRGSERLAAHARGRPGSSPRLAPDDAAPRPSVSTSTAPASTPRAPTIAVIARRGRRTVAELVTDPSALRATRALLRGARRLHVYAHPSLEARDWMALAVDGRPLHATTPTIFHADLRAPRPPIVERAPITRALVLADPPGVLPAARREADAVAARLTASGVQVTRAEGLSRRTLRAALARPLELFHYSGHGLQAGLDGLEGGIPLADGARLSTLDVLTATAVPRRAVLAACDLGRRGSTPSAPGLGFAHALLLVGADEVVAAVRPVDDAATTRWVDRLYAHLLAGAAIEDAVRATTAELAETQDATAFRLWSATW